MIAGRRSHSTLSKGDTFPSVKRRWKSRPEARRATFSVSDWLCRLILDSISTSAPAVKPSYVGWTAVRGELYSTPPALPHPGCRGVYRWIHRGKRERAGDETVKFRLPSRKNRKAQLSRAKNCDARCEVGFLPSKF